VGRVISLEEIGVMGTPISLHTKRNLLGADFIGGRKLGRVTTVRNDSRKSLKSFSASGKASVTAVRMIAVYATMFFRSVFTEMTPLGPRILIARYA
jgi:hypothetical protein